MIYRIMLLIFTCCLVTGCNTVIRDPSAHCAPIDKGQAEGYSNSQLIRELALRRYWLLKTLASHSCDCPASTKPWDLELGKGCKVFTGSLADVSATCDLLQDEFNKRSIGKTEKTEIISAFRKTWLQEAGPEERSIKENVLERLQEETTLDPLRGVAMFCAAFHSQQKECDFGEADFDQKGIAFIEEDTGIDLPDGAKGLRFHYVPPMDPIVFAKIQIPDEAKDSLVRQIEALPGADAYFPKDFANDRCQWWVPANPMLSKESKKADGYYIELYLVKEDKILTLYIKYFTI